MAKLVISGSKYQIKRLERTIKGRAKGGRLNYSMNLKENLKDSDLEENFKDSDLEENESFSQKLEKDISKKSETKPNKKQKKSK